MDKSDFKKRYEKYDEEKLHAIIENSKQYIPAARQAAAEILKSRGEEIDIPIGPPIAIEEKNQKDQPISWFIGILIIISAGFILSTLFNKVDQTQVLLDNPTNAPISFSINEEQITLESQQTITKYLDAGYNQFAIENDTQKIFLKREGNYLLNPTFSTYYYEEILYGDSHRNEASPKDFKRIPLNFVTVEGVPILGPYKKENQLLIQNWNLGPRTAIPSFITVEGGIKKEQVKLFRYSDFKKRASKNSFPFYLEQEKRVLGIGNDETSSVEQETIYHQWRNDILEMSVEQDVNGIAMMEIYSNGKYVGIVATGDNQSQFCTNTGKKQKGKLEKKASFRSNHAGTFFERSRSFKERMEAVANFTLPAPESIRFHYKSNQENYSIELPLEATFKEFHEKRILNGWRLLYKEGKSVMQELDDI